MMQELAASMEPLQSLPPQGKRPKTMAHDLASPFCSQSQLLTRSRLRCALAPSEPQTQRASIFAAQASGELRLDFTLNFIALLLCMV